MKSQISILELNNKVFILNKNRFDWVFLIYESSIQTEISKKPQACISLFICIDKEVSDLN